MNFFKKLFQSKKTKQLEELEQKFTENDRFTSDLSCLVLQQSKQIMELVSFLDEDRTLLNELYNDLDDLKKDFYKNKLITHKVKDLKKLN